MQYLFDQFRLSSQEFRKTQTLALTALFIAMNVASDALGLRIDITPQLRIGFGFLAAAMIGMLVGPVPAMAAGAASDILGYLVHPVGGVYFPGFTITAILGGMVYGVCLYRGQMTIRRAFTAKLLINLFLNVGLNSVWMTIFYGKAFWTLLPLRAGKNLLVLPLEVALLYLVGKAVERIRARAALV